MTGDLTKLRDAINETWAALYPGAEPVTDVFALTMRIRNIAQDRNDWAFNSRVLQKQLNEMEAKYNGAGQEVQAVPAPPPAE